MIIKPHKGYSVWETFLNKQRGTNCDWKSSIKSNPDNVCSLEAVNPQVAHVEWCCFSFFFFWTPLPVVNIYCLIMQCKAYRYMCAPVPREAALQPAERERCTSGARLCLIALGWAKTLLLSCEAGWTWFELAFHANASSPLSQIIWI